MPIDPIAGADAVTGAGAVTPPKQSLDSEVFLQLLVTQMRNQDPSSPMDTTQMISQTTQLATMEQLTTLTSLTEESFSLQMRQAAAELLGRQVTYTDADGQEQSGLAERVSYATAVPMVTIGAATIALDAVSGVTTTP
ncbi:flagellar hook assembly protein FlgD [Pseudactinotalea terrae]|uniref:flagellar hook assembly protein FlgD n=1 Tax=Pseudactinotalea terrae TaxID=1743262 RepID=UPI0012E1F8E4|nr:flagellar hook capping FlgD N-terminal domain-containing protein [Pseudactinotalea terrae]